jgi:hypothetical protein
MTYYCAYMTCRAYVEANSRDEVPELVNETPTEDFVEWEIDHIEEA